MSDAVAMPHDWIRPKQPEDITGWFRWMDRKVFSAILDAQADRDGVVVEIGVYLGRSAVVIGSHMGKADRFVVIDLFGEDHLLTESESDRANDKERQNFFGSPTRHVFEANYTTFVPELPEIVQRPSREIGEHVEPGTARFVHVDASHLYDQVAEDIRNVKTILREDGIIAFDDYRAVQAPGTAAAIWGACATEGMIPIAVTDNKVYATFGDPEPKLEMLRAFGDSDPRFRPIPIEIFGHTTLRFGEYSKPPATSRLDRGDVALLKRQFDASIKPIKKQNEELRRQLDRAERRSLEGRARQIARQVRGRLGSGRG